MNTKKIFSILFLFLLAWCSNNNSNNFWINTESPIIKIINWSNTLKSQYNIYNRSFFGNKKWEIEISTWKRDIMIRWTMQEFKNKDFTIETMSGTVLVTFMTKNSKLKKAMEPWYKWPFTNNILKEWENKKFSINNLSWYIDSNDEYLFVLIGNIDKGISIINYGTVYDYNE